MSKVLDRWGDWIDATPRRRHTMEGVLLGMLLVALIKGLATVFGNMLFTLVQLFS